VVLDLALTVDLAGGVDGTDAMAEETEIFDATTASSSAYT
jgi:hypothetical protein